jgi:biopolymer transport protein ExbB/biopolymer transport protein TolQ
MNIVDSLLKIALFGSAWVLYLLIALSIASIGVMIERALYFRRVSRGGGEPLREALLGALRADDAEAAEKLLRDSGTVEGGIVAAAMGFREGGAHALADALESEQSRARKGLEAGMNFLGTVGNNAPFIGLFGTVIGVIVSFHELGSAAARAGAMGNVMSGISESLVATGVGIFVALPAVVAYNLAQTRIGEIEQNATSLGRLVSAWLETRRRGGVLLVAAPAERATPARATPAAAPHDGPRAASALPRMTHEPAAEPIAAEPGN